MNELHLFAGAGGGILGGMLLGHTCVCAVEIEEYPRKILLQRQRDGVLPRFPIWDDIRTFDGNPWRGNVDVVCGGFPCQDISAAGKGAGIEGERSGLWSEMARVVREVRPQFVFMENSPMLVGRGLSLVLADLASLGYDAKWGIVGAHHVSATHRRDRIWILAYSRQVRLCGEKTKQKLARKVGFAERSLDEDWWKREPQSTPRKIESELGRVAHGVADRVDRLKAIGNGQVPAVVELAWKILAQS